MTYMMTEAQHAQIVDALNIGIAKHYDLAEDVLVGDALAMLKDMQPVEPVAQPLTDEQVETAYRELYRNEAFGQTTYEMVESGIRYAEKHHGIGAKEHGTP